MIKRVLTKEDNEWCGEMESGIKLILSLPGFYSVDKNDLCDFLELAAGAEAVLTDTVFIRGECIKKRERK
jgi:hypothetical protein